MSIIESIQNKKGVPVGIGITLIVLAAGIIGWNMRSGIPGDVRKAYYSTDDGDTYFVDDLNKVYPFDHDGKQAYRAYVFKTKSGKLFVGYLERFNEAGRAEMAALLTQPHQQVEGQIASMFTHATEAKKPHDTVWVPANAPGYSAITNVTGPDGDPDVQGVDP